MRSCFNTTKYYICLFIRYYNVWCHWYIINKSKCKDLEILRLFFPKKESRSWRDNLLKSLIIEQENIMRLVSNSPKTVILSVPRISQRSQAKTSSPSEYMMLDTWILFVLLLKFAILTETRVSYNTEVTLLNSWHKNLPFCR